MPCHTELNEAAYLSNVMDMHVSMTHASDRYVGGKKMSWVNKPKGLTVKGCRPARPPGPPSLWKTVIINYSGAHGALFERARSPAWKGNDWYLAGQSRDVVTGPVIRNESVKGREKRHYEGFLCCVFWTHTWLFQLHQLKVCTDCNVTFMTSNSF